MAEKERIKDIRTPMAAMQYIPPSAGCPSTNEELRRPSPQVPEERRTTSWSDTKESSIFDLSLLYSISKLSSLTEFRPGDYWT